MQIIVIGGGMQGCVIARNLLARKEKPAVTIADIKEPTHLPQGATFSQCNVLDAQQIAELVKNADAVALAVPSSVAYKALSNIIATGVPVVDVSFTPDPPLDLHAQALKSGSCCVVDCGVAPGLSHLLVGAAYSQLGGLDSARILVGGIPQQPPRTFKHAVYFNPHDLLSEYVRPARARKDGNDIQPHPMAIPFESFQDAELGKLDAFLSDGLRSLLTSFPDIKNMAELTLRWPGHLDAMMSLYEMGLLDSPESLAVVANTIGTKYPVNNYPDVLLMVVEGSRGDKTISWRLIDRRTNNESAMSRTTAYTTAAMTMALARKQFRTPGVYAPEQVGRDRKLVSIIIDDLREHGVSLIMSEKIACC